MGLDLALTLGGILDSTMRSQQTLVILLVGQNRDYLDCTLRLQAEDATALKHASLPGTYVAQ